MLDSPTPWQWSLLLRPDPVGGPGERVFRAPTGALLLGALTRTLDARWRTSFEDELIVEAHRLADEEGEMGHIRVRVGVGRLQLEALAQRAIAAVERAIEVTEDPQAPIGDHRWLFEHAYPGGQGRPPLVLELHNVSGCSAWAAEAALTLLGPPRTAVA